MHLSNVHPGSANLNICDSGDSVPALKWKTNADLTILSEEINVHVQEIVLQSSFVSRERSEKPSQEHTASPHPHPPQPEHRDPANQRAAVIVVNLLLAFPACERECERARGVFDLLQWRRRSTVVLVVPGVADGDAGLPVSQLLRPRRDRVPLQRRSHGP